MERPSDRLIAEARARASTSSDTRLAEATLAVCETLETAVKCMDEAAAALEEATAGGAI